MEKAESARRIKKSRLETEKKSFVFSAYKETFLGEDVPLDEDLWQKIVNIQSIRNIFTINNILGFLNGDIDASTIKNDPESLRSIKIIIYNSMIQDPKKSKGKKKSAKKLSKSEKKILQKFQGNSNVKTNEEFEFSYPNVIKFQKDLNKIGKYFKQGNVDIVLDNISLILEAEFQNGILWIKTGIKDFYVIFDSNFIIGKNEESDEYHRFYEIIKKFGESNKFSQELTEDLLIEECNGGLTSEDQEKRVNEFMSISKKLRGAGLIGYTLNFVYKLVESIECFKKTLANSQIFFDEYHNLYSYLDVCGLIDSKFGWSNYKFFEKIRTDIDRKEAKPIVVDMVIVFFSIILGINGDPIRCLVISDDSDMQVLSQILFDNIIPKYITKIVIENYSINDRTLDLLNLRDKQSLDSKIFKKVIQHFEYQKNVCEKGNEIDVGLVFSPKDKILYQSFLPAHLNFLASYADEIQVGLTNMFITCMKIDYNFEENGLSERLFERFFKKVNELIVVGKTKEELVEMMKD